MFELAVIEDMVHLMPAEFHKPMLDALIDVLNEKYMNKVLRELGLCIALYDVLSVGEPRLHHGSPAQHVSVEFRLVMFRPFVGEILVGTIIASTADAGLRLSVGFFDEIHVPEALLPCPCRFSTEESTWVWQVTDQDKLFFDLQNDARFRVTAVEFERNTAPPSAASADAPQPTMRITAAVSDEGLGLCSWWPAGEEDDGGEEEGEEEGEGGGEGDGDGDGDEGGEEYED